MKNIYLYQRIFLGFILFILLVSCNKGNAEDLRKIVELSGYWNFSIGENPQWANIDFDDSGWDQIRVPRSWESEGYEDYNGYAWYRRTFVVGKLPKEESIFLMLGTIDDADEVYLNGRLVGKSGNFPPNYQTAYNVQRKYIIPYEYFNINGENVIAVKVYDSYGDGGIVGGHVGIYLDADNDFLDYVITGQWKFHIGDDRDWRTSSYDDESWEQVNVPSEWESCGYSDYDGYAWYRKKFHLNETFSDDDLYLCLGRIDDYDQVFLNGELVGDVFKLKSQKWYRQGNEYRTRRLYKIPKGSLKIGETNVLAVRVYDGRQRGGIYEGPIGIMTKANYKRYYKKYSSWFRSNDNFFEFVFDF